MNIRTLSRTKAQARIDKWNRDNPHDPIALASDANWRCGMCGHSFAHPNNGLCPSCESDEIEPIAN